MPAEVGMNKNHTYIFIFSLLVCCLFGGCKKSNSNSSRSGEVIVYTYNSFSGEWGAGPEIARLFQEKTGIKVTYAECGDSIQILSKAILEKDNPYADVLLGLDNNMVKSVKESGVLKSFKPSNAKVLSDGLENELGNEWFLIPYDYSPFSIIINTDSKLPEPKCLEDLTKDIYKKKLILMNPQTSTPGLGFETWVRTVYGSNADDYMKRLQPSILTMAPSWSVGYGMFSNGEAPLVISYTTSPAYQVEYNEGNNFKALTFTDGHVMQVEGAGILKNCKNLEGAKKFIEFLISEEAQKIIPVTQWMYPANAQVVLPESYNSVVMPRVIDN